MMSSENFNSTIEYLRILFERFKLEREISDRWFRYYLIVIGAPLAGLLTMLQVETVRITIQKNFWLIGTLSLIIFLLGFFFHLIHVRQRIITVFLSVKTREIENQCLSQLLPKNKNKKSSQTAKFFKYGADFYVDCIQILINSVWFCVSIIYYIATIKVKDSIGKFEIIIGIACLILSIPFQFFLRSQIIKKSVDSNSIIFVSGKYVT